MGGGGGGETETQNVTSKHLRLEILSQKYLQVLPEDPKISERAIYIPDKMAICKNF